MTGSLEDLYDSDSQQKQKNSKHQQQKSFDSEQILDDHSNKTMTTTTVEKPFHIVLIDLKKAVTGQIHCVEKLLTDKDFEYVAISYRWGEVQETTVNTDVGYLATITSFDLDDFAKLCEMISDEIDLQYINYVWVDAICVNQTNLEQRKATIYHMTDIYDRATYILAVPDLHLKYLQESSINNQNIIYGSQEYGKYIYHLLQGNIQKLFDYDEQWLQSFDMVKTNQRLRHLLTHYTEYFATGFTTCRKMNYDFLEIKQKAALEHLFKTTMTTTATTTPIATSTPLCLSSIDNDDCNNNKEKLVIDKIPIDDNSKLDTLAAINKLHTCNDGKLCPFNMIFNEDSEFDCLPEVQEWKQRIPCRSQAIRQSVMYMKDLVVDWSSRAWVVSEFHIAKNKSNKMKYWFIQLGNVFEDDDDDDIAPNSFLTFHFDGDSPFFSACGGSGGDGSEATTMCRATGKTSHQETNPFQAFHTTMRRQLIEQTFFEKILKTKASRHVDRFHAILPSTEYKSILDNEYIVDSWHNINTLMSVKLELFKWMSTKHKLELLFLAGESPWNRRRILPTFATTNITWSRYSTLTAMDDPILPGNFDLTSSSTIQLIQQQEENGQGTSTYKLNIKPKEYYRKVSTDWNDSWDQKSYFLKLRELNLIDDDEDDEHCHCELILIPNFSEEGSKKFYCSDKKEVSPLQLGNIAIIGCMARNKWALWLTRNMAGQLLFEANYLYPLYTSNEKRLERCQCDDNHPGFDIY